MPVVQTNLRNTRESARQIRFEQSGGINATDVQEAIEQVSTSPSLIVPTAVNAAMSPYNVLGSDTVIYVDTSAGPVTLNLQTAAGRGGLPLEIYDKTGNASVNNINIVPAGAELIDGLNPRIINIDFGGVRLYTKDGNAWKEAA